LGKTYGVLDASNRRIVAEGRGQVKAIANFQLPISDLCEWLEIGNWQSEIGNAITGAKPYVRISFYGRQRFER
jgi:hypothetical protein